MSGKTNTQYTIYGADGDRPPASYERTVYPGGGVYTRWEPGDPGAGRPGAHPARAALTEALWRYVQGDSCDCECGPDDGVHDPGEWIPCRCNGAPCPYCEGCAALTVAGVAVRETGLCAEGRHYQRVLAALRAAGAGPGAGEEE